MLLLRLPLRGAQRRCRGWPPGVMHDPPCPPILPLLPPTPPLPPCPARLTAFGGVSWFQPWSHPPPSTAKQLAYTRRRDGGEGGPAGGGSGGGAGSEAVAAPEARVVVVEPLPLVQLSLQPAEGPAGGAQEAPDGLGMLPASVGGGDAASALSAGAAAAGAAAGGAGPRQLRLLQGQVYAAQLTITNSSRAPVGWASINIRCALPCPGCLAGWLAGGACKGLQRFLQLSWGALSSLAAGMARAAPAFQPAGLAVLILCFLLHPNCGPLHLCLCRRQKDPSSRLSIVADGAALQDQMPLAAGQSCR